MKELLADMAAALPPDAHRGTLVKKDHAGSGWRPRDFVLHHNMLYYFLPGKPRPRGAMCMDGVDIQDYRADGEQFAFQLTPAGGGGAPVVLRAADEQSKLMWMGTLRSAGYEQWVERATQSDAAHSAMSKALAAIKAELDQSRESLGALDAERATTARLEQEMRELRAEIDGFPAAVERAVAEVQERADAEAAELREELERSRAHARVQLAVVEQERRHLEEVEEQEHAALEETRQELETHVQHEQELDATVPRLESAVGALERSREHLHADLEEARAEADKRGRRVAELEDEVRSLERHLQAAREHTTSLSEEASVADAMRADLREARGELAALRTERDAMRQTHERQLTDIQENVQLLQSQVEVADRVLREEREAEAELRAERDRLRAELEEKSAALQAERGREEALEASNQELQAELSQSEQAARRAARDREMQRVKARATALSDTLREHQQQLQRELASADFALEGIAEETGAPGASPEAEEARLQELDHAQLVTELLTVRSLSKSQQARLADENDQLKRELVAARAQAARAARPSKDGRQLWRQLQSPAGSPGSPSEPGPAGADAELHSEAAVVDPAVPPITSGLLYKRGAKTQEESIFRKLQKWKQRMFIIERDSLCYYEPPGGSGSGSGSGAAADPLGPDGAAALDQALHTGHGHSHSHSHQAAQRRRQSSAGRGSGASMLGFVFLEGCEVRVPLAESRRHDHQFMVFHPSRRTLHVYADSAAQMQGWINGISAAIARANAANDAAELERELAALPPADVPDSLHNVLAEAQPRILPLFRRHLRKERSEENLDFYQRVDTFRDMCSTRPAATVTGLAPREEQHWDEDEMLAAARVLYDEFVDSRSDRMVNIPESQQRAVKALIDSADASATMFDDAQTEVFKLMNRDGFSRFKRAVGGS